MRSTLELECLLAAAIREQRLLVGMTQQQLATACGVTYQQLQKYENGSNRISFSRLVKIAEALGCSVGALTTGVDDEPPSRAPAALGAYERFHGLPGAKRLLQRYAALPQRQREALIDLIEPAYEREQIKGDAMRQASR